MAKRPLDNATQITDQARKDLSQSYRTMMEMAAWKHFEQNVLNRIEDLATKEEDNIPIHELDRSVGQIGVCRGKRLAINKIRSDIEYILNGLQ